MFIFLDLCQNYSCGHHLMCKTSNVNGSVIAVCVCMDFNKTCDAVHHNPVCGTDGMTYPSLCHLKEQASCKHVHKASDGACPIGRKFFPNMNM